MNENLCFNAFVPADYEKKEVSVAARIPERMLRELDDIASSHDRTRGYVIRELLARGLEVYRANGVLKPDIKGVRTIREPITMIEPGEETKQRRSIERELKRKTG